MSRTRSRVADYAVYLAVRFLVCVLQMLSFRLARRLGVCAHVDFRFPATLISVIPPSVLVSEFLDTMTRGFCPAINRREMPGCVWS